MLMRTRLIHAALQIRCHNQYHRRGSRCFCLLGRWRQDFYMCDVLNWYMYTNMSQDLDQYVPHARNPTPPCMENVVGFWQAVWVSQNGAGSLYINSSGNNTHVMVAWSRSSDMSRTMMLDQTLSVTCRSSLLYNNLRSRKLLVTSSNALVTSSDARFTFVASCYY